MSGLRNALPLFRVRYLLSKVFNFKLYSYFYKKKKKKKKEFRLGKKLKIE